MEGIKLQVYNLRVEMQKSPVIETTFAKDSGYGNSVYSRVGARDNANYIGQLFGPKQQFEQMAECDINEFSQRTETAMSGVTSSAKNPSTMKSPVPQPIKEDPEVVKQRHDIDEVLSLRKPLKLTVRSKEFKTVAVPKYERKQREKALANDGYHEQVYTGTGARTDAEIMQYVGHLS